MALLFFKNTNLSMVDKEMDKTSIQLKAYKDLYQLQNNNRFMQFTKKMK